MVAAILAQSNTGNGSKIYFAACLALAQIERCCAVLGRDTNRAISQQICMPEMENQTRTKVYNQSVGNIIVIPTRQHSWDTACYWVLQSVSDNKTDAEQLGGAAVDSSAVQYCLSGTIFGIIFAARHAMVSTSEHCSSLHSVSVYNVLTLLRPAATAGILSQLSIITQHFSLLFNLVWVNTEHSRFIDGYNHHNQNKQDT